jgi:hypothetical protein
MGYFSNGAEAEIYEEMYCRRCVHGQDHDTGCPVFNLHFLYSYELCNEPMSNPGKVALQMLIPREGIVNKQCTMFHEVT